MTFKQFWIIVAALVVLPAFQGTALAQAGIDHDLSVRLDLDEHRLKGFDTVGFQGFSASDEACFDLAPQTSVQSVQSKGRNLDYAFRRGRLCVETGGLKSPEQIEIAYTAQFNDPAPTDPINTDNPGYGVAGAIGPEGVLLLAGVGWYPRHPKDSTMRLQVDAPLGFAAVTSGELIGHQDQNGRTLSRWRIPRLVEGLSLTAGPYQRRTRPAGAVVAATYFTEPLQSLSSDYLQAAARYLASYQDLFGPYAFSQFAVVENFFPTGYGFPGYTLMGKRVLQLPFIVHTSLGHEIAHCWWGNGVLVDYSQGNWSEGLTTYVADYLSQERRSPQAARAYRMQWLRNYAALVEKGGGFPLSDFISRRDPVTKTIGYDKSAMIFHMLRQQVGDTVFWQTLREIYRQRRFQTTAWEDFKRGFEKNSGRDLRGFFDQWVQRAGAPELFLEQVRSQKSAAGYTISGRVRQAKPYYQLRVPIRLQTERQIINQIVTLKNDPVRFSITCASQPQSLQLDPEVNLFRLLSARETPATVNTLKGAGRVSLVISPRLLKSGTKMARRLSLSLGLNNTTVASDPVSNASAVIWIGLPADLDRLTPALKNFSADQHRFVLNGHTYDRAKHSFFGVFKETRKPVALFLPAADHPAAETVAGKITHYGKYSYLVFDGADNQEKGTWPVGDSSVAVEWP